MLYAGKTKQPVLRYKEETVNFFSEGIRVSDISLLNGQCSYETFLKSKYYKPAKFKGSFSPSSPGYAAMYEGTEFHRAYRECTCLRPKEEFSLKVSGTYKDFSLFGIVDLANLDDLVTLEEWKWSNSGIIDATTKRQILLYCYLLEDTGAIIEYKIKSWRKCRELLSDPLRKPDQTLTGIYGEKERLEVLETLDRLTDLFSGTTEVRYQVNGGCNYCDFGPRRIKTERCEYYGREL